MLLKPFQPEINHRCHKERNHLGENQAADNDQAKGTPRRGIVAEPKSKRNGTHKSGESRHHDGTKTLKACFMNCVSQTQSLIDSFQGEIDYQDSILLDYAQQKKQSDDAVKG